MTWPAALQALDEQALLAVRDTPAWLAPVFHVITVIGGGWGLIALIPFLVRRATRVATAWLLGAVVVQSALVTMLKTLVHRARPCALLAWDTPIGVACPHGPSFPSGHATGSFAFAAFIAVRAPRWAALAFAWAVLVAWSRPFFGVHYPGDVLSGALLGSAVGFCVARLSLRSTPAPAS